MELAISPYATPKRSYVPSRRCSLGRFLAIGYAFGSASPEMLRISGDEDRAGALRARAPRRPSGGCCFFKSCCRRGQAASSSSVEQKIEPAGTCRHEERAQHEADDTSTVQGGDDHEREADRDERDREHRDAGAVEPIHAASAQGAALPRRRGRRPKQPASKSSRWARARSAPARFASREERSASREVKRLLGRRRPLRGRVRA